MQPHKSWIEISADAVTHNIHALRSHLAEGVEFCAVLKANAYGHDLPVMAELCVRNDVNVFAVDSLDEALQLRERHHDVQIFILGYTPIERYGEVIEAQAIQTLYDDASIQLFAQTARERGERGLVNIKVETGTRRQGVEIYRLPQLLMTMQQVSKDIDFVGISSHFHDAENIEHPQATEQQFLRFVDALRLLEDRGMRVPYRHISCSAAALAYTDMQVDMARFGIALYGLWSSPSLKRRMRLSTGLDLHPALSWKARIAQVKDVPKGATIGYTQQYQADRPMRIAIVPVGYYDGYSRSFSHSAEVIINGQRCPVFGKICMNMFIVDVSRVNNVQSGDVVTLIGRDGMHHVSADELADIGSTIHYEIVTNIKQHLPRIVV